MAIFKNIFKGGPKKKEAASDKKADKKAVKSSTPSKAKKQRRTDEVEGKIDAYRVKNPWISEKASSLVEQNAYVFHVQAGANKKTIKEEIEFRYKVGIKSVRTIRRQGKTKRFRSSTGKKSGFKKAIVTLKKGEKIDMV
ncbi:50S ribosomal protein L23 [bacterium]|mgnify:CR=1 FL=1|nr:50S ribosomal protein L23 [bacterium]|tara:strand:+ start:136 stop:552 length:417 start_codon:yes stop_codon:yes gene_type:complete